MILRKCILTATFLIGLTQMSSAITAVDIVNGVSEESYAELHTGLYIATGNSRGFTDGSEPRMPGYQHDLARDFIQTNFQAMGYDTWLDSFEFTYRGKQYINANNVVAVKPGMGGTNIFIVGAHYDSVDSGQSTSITVCPGADDNASGVAGILEAAKAIQDFVFRDTIIFIAFDAEEKGYHGASHFLNEHITDLPSETNATTFLKSSIKAMISADMIGYDDTNNLKRIVIGTVLYADTNSAISLALADSSTTYTDMVPRLDGGYNQSDHLPFHNAGIPAVHLIEHDLQDYWNNPPTFIGNPHYHTALDSIDTPNYINHSYAADATKCIVGYLCDQARVIPPATMTTRAISDDKIEVQFYPASGVTYDLYGNTELINSNGWTLLQTLAPTNAPNEQVFVVDLNTVSQSLFRVFSK